MALQFPCDKCGREINESAALIFSPPEKHYSKKWHLCRPCYGGVVEWLREENLSDAVNRAYSYFGKEYHTIKDDDKGTVTGVEHNDPKPPAIVLEVKMKKNGKTSSTKYTLKEFEETFNLKNGND